MFGEIQLLGGDAALSITYGPTPAAFEWRAYPCLRFGDAAASTRACRLLNPCGALLACRPEHCCLRAATRVIPVMNGRPIDECVQGLLRRKERTLRRRREVEKGPLWKQ